MPSFARALTIPEGQAGRRQRLGVLLVCSSSLFIVYLDSTILNVALPTLQKDLHASLSGLQWVADAYLLVVASLLMLTGSTADRLGRRKLFLIGLAGFGAGSLLCSVAPSTGWLIALRMLQGVGGSMLTPISLSIVRNTFHDPKERVQALGIWSGIFGVATACGPIAGGVLVSTIGWRSIFWLNVPICAAMIAATLRYVPESRAPRPRRVDVPGQLLMIALLGSLTYAVIQGPVSGWTARAGARPVRRRGRRRGRLRHRRAAHRASRWSSCGSSGPGRSPAPAVIAVLAFTCSAGSCSSSPCTCSRCGATRRCGPGCRCCPPRW